MRRLATKLLRHMEFPRQGSGRPDGRGKAARNGGEERRKDRQSAMESARISRVEAPSKTTRKPTQELMKAGRALLAAENEDAKHLE